VGTDTGLYVLAEEAARGTSRPVSRGHGNQQRRARSGGNRSRRARGRFGSHRRRGRHVTSLGAGRCPTGRAVAVARPIRRDLRGTDRRRSFAARRRRDLARKRARRRVAGGTQLQYPGTMNALRDITIDRENPECVYAAVQIGGVLRTEDGGAHWEDITSTSIPTCTRSSSIRRSRVLFAVTGAAEYPHPTPEHRISRRIRTDAALQERRRGRTWTSISDDFQSYGIPIAALGAAVRSCCRRRVRRAAALDHAARQSRCRIDRQ